MTIQFDEDAMRPIIAKAILDEIGPEQRDLLIQNALDTLMKPGMVKGQYGRPDERTPSMLEEIVREKVRSLAVSTISELLENSPVLADQIRDQIRDGVLAALAREDNGWLTSAIGYAAGESITKILGERR